MATANATIVSAPYTYLQPNIPGTYHQQKTVELGVAHHKIYKKIYVSQEPSQNYLDDVIEYKIQNTLHFQRLFCSLSLIIHHISPYRVSEAIAALECVPVRRYLVCSL